ncbi:double-stranded RNA-binding protein 8 [Elaeis guineensis]|uniref:Double-stranded RNA-binding protein 8 n=1 Tax=Elaeis guineensis var. tenera TaxID=51953 RepID=A0A6I9QXI6_ELAGV|nr:double-stranded RNA-binding protein 8 [Elaeis guineensis]
MEDSVEGRGLQASCLEAETATIPPSFQSLYSSSPPFSNPLLQPPPAAESSPPALRYDNHTAPMSAFSGAHCLPNPPPSRRNGVANCYVFKSRLQEYAQKVGLPTPEYQTVKEGPSHEPVFRSTVIVNNVRYDSLPGFFNRKAAEQSAAEIALMEIHKSGQMKENLPTVHETGLCKNLLQEYAQKMNYAIPSYVCNKQPSGTNPFTCTVEVGGIQYIGAAARTKKEAEIKAARTALLAIQSQSEAGTNGASQYTVLPSKKKGKEQETNTEAVKQLKPKKTNFKKKWSKRRFARNKDERMVQSTNDELGNVEINDASRLPGIEVGMSEVSKDSQGQVGALVVYENQQGLNMPSMEADGHCQDKQEGLDFHRSGQGSSNMDVSTKVSGENLR